MNSLNSSQKTVAASHRKQALFWYLASVTILATGSYTAAHRFPGGYDWHYMVASALASKKDNPAGSAWFASGLSLSMVLLWPFADALKKNFLPTPPPLTKFANKVFRLGIICGLLIGVEGLLIRDLSHWVTKGHEILGLLMFFGLYLGIVSYLVQAMRQRRLFILPALLITVPLLAISVTQLWLYFEQRDIGWVHTNWKETDIPLWMSFAFWQWSAIAFLELGLGFLSLAYLKDWTDKAMMPNQRREL